MSSDPPFDPWSRSDDVSSNSFSPHINVNVTPDDPPLGQLNGCAVKLTTFLVIATLWAGLYQIGTWLWGWLT